MQLKGRDDPPPAAGLAARPIKGSQPSLTGGAVELALYCPASDAFHPLQWLGEDGGFWNTGAIAVLALLWVVERVRHVFVWVVERVRHVFVCVKVSNTPPKMVWQ